MRKLRYEIKDLRGFVLGVGYINDSLLKEMNKNDYIKVDLLTSDFLNATKKNMVDKEIRKKKKKGKTIYIKKLKKAFRHDKPDYIICNIDDVMNYLKYFVKDSLYITNERIYIYSESKKNDLTNIEKKYRRYINDVVNGDEYIIINTINYKRNIFKNLWYYIVDTFTSIYDFIGNILTN